MFSDFFQGEVGLYSQVLKCINFQGVGTKLTFSEAPAAPKAGLQGVNLLEFGGESSRGSIPSGGTPRPG